MSVHVHTQCALIVCTCRHVHVHVSAGQKIRPVETHSYLYSAFTFVLGVRSGGTRGKGWGGEGQVSRCAEGEWGVGVSAGVPESESAGSMAPVAPPGKPRLASPGAATMG